MAKKMVSMGSAALLTAIAPHGAWAQQQSGGAALPDAHFDGSSVTPDATTTPPAAADTIQDIVVTAQRRAESLQKVPIAVTAITGDALVQRGLNNVVDLANSVPGFQAQEFSGVIIPFLRGVGATGVAISNEPEVAIYVDGIYYPRIPSDLFDLRNVQRVEVLKGPQGTLFGRNSTGGVINVVTGDPSHDARIDGSVSYGRFDTFDGSAYVTGGLTDTVAADLSVSGKTTRGYGRNLTLDKRFNYDDGVVARSKLLFEPSTDTRFILSGFYSASKDSGNNAGYPGTDTSTITPPFALSSATPIPGVPTSVYGYYNSANGTDTFTTFHEYGVTLRAEQQLPFARLISLTAYTRERERNSVDGDFTARDDLIVKFNGRVNLFTQEIQLASLPGSAVSWIGGFYYYNNATAYDYVSFTGPAVPAPGLLAPGFTHSISYAGFSQATYEILPRLKLTGGLRFTHDEVSAHGNTYLALNPPLQLTDLPASSSDYNRLTFKAAVDYAFTNRVLGYASFSRGYQAGKYNILTYSPEPTAPEGIDAYELGLKSDLLDRRVRLNGALFYYDIRNPQVQLQTAGTIIYSNAGGAHVKGGEIDLQAVPARGLTLRASGTYLDSKYTNYDNAPASRPDLVNGGAVGFSIDAAGNRTPLASKLTFNVGADYTVRTSTGEVTLTVDLYHNSGFYWEPDNLLHQRSYNLLDGQLRYKLSDTIAVRLFGKNLLDKRYANAGSTNVGTAGYQFHAAPPRTYGLAVDFKF